MITLVFSSVVLYNENMDEGNELKPKKKWWIWLIGLAVVALAAFLIWEFWGGDDEDGDTVSFESVNLAEKKCEGVYIDTHAHWDNEEYPETLSQKMESNKVGCAILFTGVNPSDLDESLIDLEEDLNPYIDKYIPFFHVNPKAASDINVANVAKANEIKDGYFTGFGEIAFYRDPFKSAELTDENWQPVLKYLGEKDLWLMFHLRGENQIQGLEATLTKYPENKFLLHGPELYKELPELLEKYSNLYFTLDTASLIQMPGNQPGGILMYPDGFQKSGFDQKYDANKEAVLEQAIAKWKPVVLAAPERVMWGTDVSLEWHTDEDIYSKLISFSDEFAAALPQEIQKPYKYDNAYELFVTQ